MSGHARSVWLIEEQMGRLKRVVDGGKEVRFGNNVSFSQRKTRRRWNPNIQKKKIFSEVLGRTIRIPVTTSVLRTIEKYEGFDNYILNYPLRKFEAQGSEVAVSLRKEMKEKIKEKEGH